MGGFLWRVWKNFLKIVCVVCAHACVFAYVIMCSCTCMGMSSWGYVCVCRDEGISVLFHHSAYSEAGSLIESGVLG